MGDLNNEEYEDVEQLDIRAIIGFDGSTRAGLIVHPEGKHIMYPQGDKISIVEWTTKKQDFLTGHTNIISTIACSRSGKYVASGQINHIGFKTRVILWDFYTRSIISQHELHKVRVEAVCFSHDDSLLLSMGGRDCGSVIVWEVEGNKVLCGSAVSRGIQGEATTLLSLSKRSACFVTAGENHLAVWHIDRESRMAHSIDVNLLKLKRLILCMDADERDNFLYCGTSTGDIYKVRLNFHHDPDIIPPVKIPSLFGCFTRISKRQLPQGKVDLYLQGVVSIKRLFGGAILVGAGDGTLELVEEVPIKDLQAPPRTVPKLPTMAALLVKKSTKLKSSVTSIQMMGTKTILAGTQNCEVWSINLDTFNTTLVITCHTNCVYDIAFPYDFSEVFATASRNDVRVWSSVTMQELLRIRVPNFCCSTVLFTKDGKSILTAWNDGVIRSFTPLTGRLIYAIMNAHNKGVSALATTQHGKLLVSGGCEGQVRLWKVDPHRQNLECVLKEHKGPISSIHVNYLDTEAVSASTDGSCIIWDLEKRVRRQILFSNTLFMGAKYYPTGVQILTCGSDRKLAYWEVLDGTMVREIEGSISDCLNCIDISPDGENFISAGNDQIVKLWRYQEGITTHIGIGHAGVITAAKFSPDGQNIITASAAGSVFVWKTPEYVKKEDKDKGDPNIENLNLDQGEGGGEDVRDLPSSQRVEAEHVGAGDAACVEDECVCKEQPPSRRGGECVCDDDPCKSSSRSSGSKKSQRSQLTCTCCTCKPDAVQASDAKDVASISSKKSDLPKRGSKESVHSKGSKNSCCCESKSSHSSTRSALKCTCPTDGARNTSKANYVKASNSNTSSQRSKTSK